MPMSVFKVVLNNKYMGQLDIDPRTGAQEVPSIQRTMFAPGPHGTFREIADGTTFTDCNYWKTYAYPALPHDQAFIQVLVDDGSIWTPNDEFNTVPTVNTGTIAAAGSVTIDYTLNGGSYAVFTQISNTGSNPMTVVLNGSSAPFTLAGGNTQVFNKGDLNISAITLASTLGTTYTVIAGTTAVCYT